MQKKSLANLVVAMDGVNTQERDTESSKSYIAPRPQSSKTTTTHRHGISCHYCSRQREPTTRKQNHAVRSFLFLALRGKGSLHHVFFVGYKQVLLMFHVVLCRFGF